MDASRDKILRDANEEAFRILKEAKDVADETIRNFNKYGKEIFEVFIIFTDAGFGIFDEVFAKTKFFRDRKGVTFSRNTD